MESIAMSGTMSITEFLTDYKNAKNKDQEALAISKVLEKVHSEQEARIAENKKELLEETNLKDLAIKDGFRAEFSNYPTKEDLRNELSRYPTKEDIKNELSHYPTKADLANAISTAKWQVIGVVLSIFIFSLLIPIVLKHMGV